MMAKCLAEIQLKVNHQLQRCVAHMRQVCFHGSLLGHEVELITEEAATAVRSGMGLGWSEGNEQYLAQTCTLCRVVCTFCRMFESNRYGLLRLSETSGILKFRKCLQLRRSGGLLSLHSGTLFLPARKSTNFLERPSAWHVSLESWHRYGSRSLLGWKGLEIEIVGFFKVCWT